MFLNSLHVVSLTFSLIYTLDSVAATAVATTLVNGHFVNLFKITRDALPIIFVIVLFPTEWNLITEVAFLHS